MSTVEHILKLDDDRRILYGYASVITEKGQPVIDLQGDVIEADELHNAVDEFMKSVRTAKLNHEDAHGSIGTVIHSLVLTKDIAAALGIDTGGREGWIVGLHVQDDALWKSIKSGKSGLGAFSIGATAIREEV